MSLVPLPRTSLCPRPHSRSHSRSHSRPFLYQCRMSLYKPQDNPGKRGSPFLNSSNAWRRAHIPNPFYYARHVESRGRSVLRYGRQGKGTWELVREGWFVFNGDD